MQLFRYRVSVLVAALATLGLASCHPDDDDPTPTPDAAFTYTGGACQANCPVTFQNTSQNATTYAWDFGDNTSGDQAEAQFTHIYAQAGTYRVKLRARNGDASDTTSQRVVVGLASGCTPQIVQITSNITTPTTWEPCNVYVVSGNLAVTSTLTVQPGTVVKFKKESSLALDGSGRIEAVGTAALPIFFTSFKDDSHGGDTNADAGASTPARKDWQYCIVAGQSGSRLEHCQFLYGGGNGTSSYYTLALHGVAATVRNCTFAHNAGGAPSMLGALSAERALDGTVLASNSFFDNELPLRIINLFSLDNSNVFQNPQKASEKNDYNGIWVEEAAGKSTALTWSETEVPYVLATTNWDAPLTLGPGVTLKLLPGAEMHFGIGSRLLARGTGAQPIVFTSYRDDAHGGDTNHDGASTTPAKKDWHELILDGISGSELDNCQFYYGGKGGTTLDLQFSVASVTNCTFAHNGEDVASLLHAAIDASYAKQGTTLRNNVFYDNVRPLSITSSFDLDDSNTFHNPTNANEKNQYQGIITYWNSNESKAEVSWGETEVAYANIQTIDLKIDYKLRLAKNVTVKMLPEREITCRQSPEQLVNATGSGVTFTSYKDDSRGGDSNGNGAANSPSRGDWYGIYYDDNSGEWLRWGNIYYASH